MPRGRPKVIPMPSVKDSAIVDIQTGAIPKEDVRVKHNLTHATVNELWAQYAPKHGVRIKAPRQPRAAPDEAPPQTNPVVRYIIGTGLLAGGLAIAAVEVRLAYEYSVSFGPLLGILAPLLSGLLVFMPSAIRMLWKDRQWLEASVISIIFLLTWSFATFNQVSYSARNTGNVNAESAAIDRQRGILNDQLANFQARMSQALREATRRDLDIKIKEVRQSLADLPKIATRDLGAERISDVFGSYVKSETLSHGRDLFYGVLPSFGCLFVSAGISLLGRPRRRVAPPPARS